MIVPITDWKDRYSVAPWMVCLEPDAENGLVKTSAADAFQVRSVSQERFIQRMGKISDDVMKKITSTLAEVLSIEI